MHDRMTHLQRLEAEAIHIMREVVAEAENPVMLYSIGKDSSVMLHIAMKAFIKSPPSIPELSPSMEIPKNTPRRNMKYDAIVVFLRE